MTRRVLVLGSTGELGQACARALSEQGWDVMRASRSGDADVRTTDLGWVELVKATGVLDAVVWASGCNWNDTVLDDRDSLERMLDGNVLYIQDTMRELVLDEAVARPSRFVILSSIWQQTARANKFSYMVSKAAVGGLVASATADLAERGIGVNGVLPGPVDTPMTRANLRPDQLSRFETETPLRRLVTAREVAETVAWLCSEASSGINGQSILVDGGWSGTRVV